MMWLLRGLGNKREGSIWFSLALSLEVYDMEFIHTLQFTYTVYMLSHMVVNWLQHILRIHSVLITIFVMFPIPF